MDLEFPDISITEKVSIINKDLIKCPKCKTVMHNPRYEK